MFTNLREAWTMMRGGEVIHIHFTKVRGSKRSPTYTYNLYSNRVLVWRGKVTRHRVSAGWRALLRQVIAKDARRKPLTQEQLDNHLTQGRVEP